jgi:hypothetical protein
MWRPRFAFLQTAAYQTILEEWSILLGNYPEMPVLETEPRAALSVPERDFWGVSEISLLRLVRSMFNWINSTYLVIRPESAASADCHEGGSRIADTTEAERYGQIFQK